MFSFSYVALFMGFYFATILVGTILQRSKGEYVANKTQFQISENLNNDEAVKSRKLNGNDDSGTSYRFVMKHNEES